MLACTDEAIERDLLQCMCPFVALNLGAVPLDRVSTAAIEGTTDQMWSQAGLDGRTKAAAVNAMRVGRTAP
jgi:hypothetical protein